MFTGTYRPRKIRSDARLEQLDATQRERLRVWLEDENRSYTDVAARVRQEFGLSVGRTAVSAYYQQHLVSEHHDEAAEVAALLAARSTGCFDAAAVNRARMLAFSALVRPDPQIATAAKLLEIVRRAEKQQLAAERLELEKQRIALRQKELALRSRRQPRTNRRASPDATAPASIPLPAEPATTPAKHTSSQKIPQNPPLYSGYFALSRPPAEAQPPAPQPCPDDTSPASPYPLRTSPLSPWSESSQMLRAA